MRLVTSSLVAAGAVAGLAGGVLAYQSAALAGPGTAPAAHSARVPDPKPKVRVKWLPCERGTKLVNGSCVRVKEHLVYRSAPAAALRTSSPSAQSPATSTSQPAPRADSVPASPTVAPTGGSGDDAFEPGDAAEPGDD